MSKHPSPDGQTQKEQRWADPTLVEEARRRFAGCQRTHRDPCDRRAGNPDWEPWAPIDWCDNCLIRALLASQEAAPSARAEGSTEEVKP